VWGLVVDYLMSSMNPSITFLIGISVVAGICLFIVLYLKNLLNKILLELMPGHDNPAKFWTAYINLILFLFPIIFAMTYIPKSNDELTIFFQVSRQIMRGLIGMVLSLAAVGIVLLFFVPKK